MRHVAQPSRRPLRARRSRALFTALVSLGLVIGALPSSAAPGDPSPSPDEVEALLREAADSPDAQAQAQAQALAVDDPGTGIGPLFVPPGDPGDDQAKIIIRAGGDRTGTGDSISTATPLADASFDIYRMTSAMDPGNPPTGVLVASCTTDATGECGAFVDLPGDLAGVDAFYAVQTAAPTGWVAPTQWGIGQDYIFATGPIDATAAPADRIVELPAAFNATVTEPSWPSVRPNPLAAPQCGLDMALIMDLSNSVTETETLLDEYKEAAKGFVNGLIGTPSQVALYTFATAAPADGATNGGVPMTSVATAAGAATLTNQIDGFTQPPGGAGGTNWDRGLYQVAESADTYDVVLFVTDGQPTFHRDRQGPGNVSTIAEVNEAILSANAVKATGSQLILVGIGPEAFLPGADIRIPLISGPTEDVDFYRADYGELSATLEEIATANCTGTLTVVKEIEEPDGTIVDGGEGWTFSTSTSDVTPASAATDATSAVNFDVAFPDATLTRPVTITETQQTGYELAQVGGQNAVCTDIVSGAAVPVTNSGALGFTVDVEADDIVSCTVRNLEIPPDYDDLTVTTDVDESFARDFEWTVEKLARQDRIEIPEGNDATFTYDVAVTPSGPFDTDFSLEGTVTVNNPNPVAVTGVDIDVPALPTGTCTVAGATGVTIAANSPYTTTYSCDLPVADATTSGTSTATATWDPVQLPGTTGTATATAPFDFADAAITVTDDVVTVTDTEINLGDYDDGVQTGNVLTAAAGATVFTYSVPWPGVAGQCQAYPNTASATNDVGTVVDSATEVVTVCAAVDLEVGKNVVHSFDRTYLWTIDKAAEQTVLAVDPDTGTATFDYTVDVTPVANGWSDSGWAMTGTISVENPNTWLDITADITDTVDVGGGATCTVTGGTNVLVPAGALPIDLDYVCTFTSQPAYVGTNTVTATWSDALPTPTSSATGTAAVEADAWSISPVNDVITVMDDKTDPANPTVLGTATWNDTATPTTFTYSVDLEAEPGQCLEDVTNTAWIAETGQVATEAVTACAVIAPVVTNAPDASYDRLYEWDITKSVDDTDIEVDANGQATFDYTVEAVPLGVLDSGWEMTGTISVTNPNTFADGAITIDVSDLSDVGGLCTIDGGATAVGVAPGGTESFNYSCTFTEAPEYVGTNTATVSWSTTGGDGGEVSAPAPVTFDEDVATDVTVEVWDDKTDPATLVHLGDAVWDDPSTHTFTYALTQQGVGGQCLAFTNNAWLELAAGASDPATTSVDLCVESPLTHDKTAVSANQLANGHWQVRYEIDVVNDALFESVYSLSDTLELGGGIVPTAAAWFPAGDPLAGEMWSNLPDDTTAVLADDRPIAAGATHTYVVVLDAEVAAGVVGAQAGQCSGVDGTDGGGFLNAATLTALDQDVTVRDCLEPVAPGVVKQVLGGPTANDDGTYSVVYGIDVVNPHDDQTVTYDLVDELLHFAAGVVVTDASVERDGTSYEAWDGLTQTQIVSGVELPAGAVHSYTVTVTVDITGVTAPAGQGVRECGLNGSNRGQGLYNETVLTSGNDDYDDEACVPVPDPTMEVDKTVASADQLPDGTWQVVYQVVAANTSAVGGVYDLTDTLELGDGLTALSAQWVLDGTELAGTWNLPEETSAVLATERPLEGGTQDTYTVTVVADVAQGVVEGLTGEGMCTGAEGTSGGGFLNSATILAHGVESTDSACAEPSRPTIEKTFETAVEQDDDTWVLTYTLAVDNSGNPGGAYYDLVDVPQYAEAITILDQRVMDVSDPQNPVSIPWDGTSAIVETVAIDGGDTHRYEVTFDVELARDITVDALTCTAEGSGHGFFNTATLTTGHDTLYVEACGSGTEPVPTPWTLSKTSTPGSGAQVAPGDVIEYTLRATPTGEEGPIAVVVRDDLADVLEHATSRDDVTVSTGVTRWDGEVLVWDIGVLDRTETLTYSVVVDDDAWDVTLVNVATGTGSTPPTCDGDCSTTHTTPPLLPGLPITGTEVRGMLLAALLLTLGGFVLVTTRRRREG